MQTCNFECKRAKLWSNLQLQWYKDTKTAFFKSHSFNFGISSPLFSLNLRVNLLQSVHVQKLTGKVYSENFLFTFPNWASDGCARLDYQTWWLTFGEKFLCFWARSTQNCVPSMYTGFGWWKIVETLLYLSSKFRKFRFCMQTCGKICMQTCRKDSKRAQNDANVHSKFHKTWFFWISSKLHIFIFFFLSWFSLSFS